jgi:3-isopropylmalate/(R)-2-methylmalate dehydratase small subunit
VLTVDLEELTITNSCGLRIPFELDAHTQETLVHGLDDIARTLKREAEIDAYEATHNARFDTRALPV